MTNIIQARILDAMEDAFYTVERGNTRDRLKAALGVALEESAKIAEGQRVVAYDRDNFSLEVRLARDHAANYIAMQLRGIAP